MLVLNLITFLNLLLIFSILFFRKNNPLPNRILALILINPGINFISNVNTLAGGLETFPYLYFFAQATALLFAPLVLIYTQQLIQQQPSWKNPLYWITAGTVLLDVYYTVEFMGMSAAQQKQYLQGVLNEPYPEQMVIINGLFILLQQAYFTQAAIQVYQYRKRIFHLLSSFEKTKADYVTKFIVLIWILNFITVVLYVTLPSVQVEYIYLPVVLTIIYSFILYFCIRHNSLFTEESYADFKQGGEVLTVDKPLVKNSLPDESATDDVKQTAVLLEQYMDRHEPFVNPELTLNGIAQDMKLPSRKISLALNKIIGKTFYDYVNEKRIEKSKVLLVQRKEITIEGVAYEAGFSSRASFYRAFKKYTDKTPTEYMEEVPA